MAEGAARTPAKNRHGPVRGVSTRGKESVQLQREVIAQGVCAFAPCVTRKSSLLRARHGTSRRSVARQR